MNKLMIFALASSFAGAPALAHTLNVEARDVRAGRADGRSLSDGQATRLSLEVSAARFLLRTLRNKQGLMTKIGVDGYGDWRTISIGAGTTAAQLFAGIAMLKYLPQERLVGFSADVRDMFVKMNLVEDELEALHAQREASLSRSVESEAAKEIEKQIEEVTARYQSYAARAKAIQESAPLWQRAQRPARILLAWTVGPLLIYDAATQAVQIMYDVSHDDRDLIGSLSKFIEDGRATLADRG